MCRKNEVDWSFIKFVTLFIPRDSLQQNLQFVHGKTFEVQHEMPILAVELKRHTECITNVQFPSNFLSMSPKLCF